jgi:hypothetical protein
MCQFERRFCACGRNSAFLSFRDNILSAVCLINLYCPECRSRAAWNGATMVKDCGWVMEYDLVGARALFWQRAIKTEITPEFIFDEGYLTWLGLAPGDQELNSRLHRRLEPLIEEDLNLYLKTLKTEWLAHVAELKAAGWRKALRA